MFWFAPYTPSSAEREPSVPAEVEAFIQNRAYYYIGRWHKLGRPLTAEPSGTFNWAAFFLTYVWMAYRKMYGNAIAVIGVDFLLTRLVEACGMPSTASLGVSMGLCVVIGTYGSALYKRHVLRRLSEIPPNLPDHLRRQAIKCEGGTSWIAACAFVALSIGWVFLTLH